MTGTVLGVLANDRGTCVCVSAGSVTVTEHGGIPEEVAQRESYLVYRDPAHTPSRMPFGEPDEHVGPLLSFSDED